jgi:hypothetical protein
MATIQMSGTSTYWALPERTKFGAKTRIRPRQRRWNRFNAFKQAAAPQSKRTAPLELAYATNRDGNSDGKIIFPVLISLIDLVSAGNTTRDPKQALYFGQCQT